MKPKALDESFKCIFPKSSILATKIKLIFSMGEFRLFTFTIVNSRKFQVCIVEGSKSSMSGIQGLDREERQSLLHQL